MLCYKFTAKSVGKRILEIGKVKNNKRLHLLQRDRATRHVSKFVPCFTRYQTERFQTEKVTFKRSFKGIGKLAMVPFVTQHCVPL